MNAKWMILVLVLEICGGNCWSVMFFAEEGFKGKTVALTGGEDECVDVPEDFTPLSMTTQGFCLRVFRETSCLGETLAFFPGSNYHHALKRFRFRIKSMRSCRTAF